MSQLSNGHGVIVVEGDKAIGWCGNTELCNLPLPASRIDAEAMIFGILNSTNGIGVTAEMFMQKHLMRIVNCTKEK